MVRAVTTNKVGSAVLEAEKEFSVAGKPVQLSDYQRGLIPFGVFQCLRQLGSFFVRLAAGFNF